MQKPNQVDDLNKTIALLEQKKEQDFQTLKHQLRATGESLKPANLIKGAMRDVAASSHLKSMLIKAGIGLAVGLIAKKLLAEKKQPVKQVARKSTRLVDQAINFGAQMLSSRKEAILKAGALYVANHLIQAFRERSRRKRQYQNGTVYREDIRS